MESTTPTLEELLKKPGIVPATTAPRHRSIHQARFLAGDWLSSRLRPVSRVFRAAFLYVCCDRCSCGRAGTCGRLFDWCSLGRFGMRLVKAISVQKKMGQSAEPETVVEKLCIFPAVLSAGMILSTTTHNAANDLRSFMQ